MARRIIILGGPRVGKTTLSQKLKDELSILTTRHSDDLKHLDWSESSTEAAKWFSDSGDWICEGVQMARGLRKWLQANPEKLLDVDIIWLTRPQAELLKGQEVMAKGVRTVFEEIQPELITRGAWVHKFEYPDTAATLLDNSISTNPLRDVAETSKGVIPRMAYKRNLTKVEWEALPEAARTFFTEQKVYVADGENWKLDADDSEDVAKLTAAIKKERDARTQFEKDLKAEREKFKDVDPAKYAELMSKQQEAEDNELKAKGKIDELLQKQREALELKLSDQKKKYEEQITSLNTQLDEVIIDQTLRSAYEKAGMIPDRIDSGVKLTRDKAQRKDGKMLLLDDTGTVLDMSPENYAKELVKTSMPWLFQGTNAAGTGADNGTHANGGGKAYKRADWEKMAPAQQSAVMAEVRSGKAQLVEN